MASRPCNSCRPHQYTSIQWRGIIQHETVHQHVQPEAWRGSHSGAIPVVDTGLVQSPMGVIVCSQLALELSLHL